LQKGEGGDVTHGIDQFAEDVFVKRLGKYGRIYSEESGYIGQGDHLITIDPLDGSDNFLSRFPYYGTSVALENEAGDMKVGIVVNLPAKTIFLKTKNLFLTADLFTLKMQEVVANPNPKIGIFERAYRSLVNAEKLKRAQVKYRAPGAVALSLAMAKDVSFVIMEGVLRDFDIKAGLFMCEGLYQHKTNDLTIICHHENIFEQLKKILLEDAG